MSHPTDTRLTIMDARYIALRDCALKLIPIIEQGRRPLIVEVTGTPKSGKSTSIRMLAGFFEAAGWDVQVIREQAELCPLPMKGHFEFNTWTTCRMLAELVDAADSERHLVILDRGLFDATVWLERQKVFRLVSENEAEVFENFVGLDRWRKLQDLVLLVTVTPEEGMRRENLSKLIPKPGSLMNPDALSGLTETFERMIKDSGYPHAVIDTSAPDRQKEVVAKMAEQVIEAAMGPYFNPSIAVVTRVRLEELLEGGNGRRWDRSLWTELRAHIEYRPRNEAENDASVVQLVAAGVQVSDDQVFVLERTSDSHYGKHLLWKGKHVYEGEAYGLEIIGASLVERLRDDLHLQEAVDQRGIKPLGVVYTPQHPNGRGEPKHAALVFEVPIVPELQAHLVGKKFKTRGRIDPARMAMHGKAELAATGAGLDLEPWSVHILSEGWLTE